MLPEPILPNNSKNDKVVLQFFDHIALAGSSIVLISVSVSVNWLLFSFEKVLREAEELEGGRGGSSRFGWEPWEQYGKNKDVMVLDLEDLGVEYLEHFLRVIYTNGLIFLKKWIDFQNITRIWISYILKHNFKKS